MASSFVLPVVLNPPLTDREAVIDVLYRCCVSFDTNDKDLFDSTFLATGVFVINGNSSNGLPKIHASTLKQIFSVDTSHMVSNVRVDIKDDHEASLTATVLSQHFAGGKGMESDEKHLMGGTLYRGDLTRDVDGLWKFKLLTLKSL